MTADPLSFFTIDHGTASTAVSLIAPFGGRFRLLAASAAPRGVAVDALLEDLVARVRAVEPDALPVADDWRSWARLEVATAAPPSIVIVAATEALADDLDRSFSAAGWEVAATFEGARADPLAITAACLDRNVLAIVLGATEPAASGERTAIGELAAVVAAAACRRAGLHTILSGGARIFAYDFPEAQTLLAPPPDHTHSGTGSLLVEMAAESASRWTAVEGRPIPDGRRAFAMGVASLSALLDRPVDGLDVGHSASSRVVATPNGAFEQIVDAEAALVPRGAMKDDSAADAILRWCAFRSEPFGLRDRLRNLRLAPWRDASGDGARLRMAALRASLASLAVGGPPPSGLIACSGGVFGAVPPPVAALAVLDAFRRPGVLSLLWDHARLLAPIGTLTAEADRRRLLSELLDDGFIPMASAVVVADLHTGRHPATLHLTSAVGTTDATLEPGNLRTMDLPPGVTARAEFVARDPMWLGVRGRHVLLDVSGGLGGLLLDTREVPLRWPERPERRRAVLEGWERPLWAAAET